MNGFGGSALVRLIFNAPVAQNASLCKVSVGGCSVNTKKGCFQLKYKENDCLCLRSKAERGILCKVVIKKIVINSGRNGNCFNKPHSHLLFPLYFDTLNAIYMEEELVTKEEAIEIASLFYQNQIEETQKAIDSLGCG